MIGRLPPGDIFSVLAKGSGYLYRVKSINLAPRASLGQPADKVSILGSGESNRSPALRVPPRPPSQNQPHHIGRVKQRREQSGVWERY